VPDERSKTPDMQYPFVDLFTGATVMPLMYLNALATWWLFLASPWFMETPMRLDSQSRQKQLDVNRTEKESA
jgi:hypothetical protein